MVLKPWFLAFFERILSIPAEVEPVENLDFDVIYTKYDLHLKY